MFKTLFRKQPDPLKGALAGALAGAAASYLKALAEPPLQRLTEDLWPPTAAQKELVGADPIGHQDNMPPAVMIEAAAEELADTRLSKKQKLAYQQVVHYAMGTALGAVYGALAEYQPGVARGLGMPAGAVMYLLTHASAVPATGFQKWPWQLPRAAVAWESGSHLVFGAGVELVRKPLRKLLD
jgi:putative membrane protein